MERGDIPNAVLAVGSAAPFIKWPGGKRWLASEIQKLFLESKCLRYIEPFLGGGAIYFSLSPRRAILSDINGELINAYRETKRRPKELIQIISQWPTNKEEYLRRRAWHPDTPIEQAARFLFLNRTCFGGMYRVNQKGKFNVPYGNGDRTPECLWKKGLLERASKALKSAKILCSDFEEILESAEKGDFVYCDPTYTVAHNNNGFRRYNERVFSWDDQERLAKKCREARKRGATVVVSNAFHESILELYKSAEVFKVSRRSLLNPDPTKRPTVDEVVLRLK